MSTTLVNSALPALRRFLLSGNGSVDAIAAELTRQYKDHAGIGIAVYSCGRQLACSVSLRTSDRASMAQLLKLVQSQLPAEIVNPVVLLSKLGSPRIVSIDEYRTRGIHIGLETIAAVRRGRMALILAHVPCFMSWSSSELGEALVRKLGGDRPLELHVFPTETFWLDNSGPELTCRGGLRERRACVTANADLRNEIQLVASYLRGQLSETVSINYAYDPWRGHAVHV